MPKLTLQFKGKPIDVYPLVDTCVTIGRDPDNSIQIDSLAIAPLHVSLQKTDEGYTLEAQSEQYPVLLNDHPTKDQTLSHGDIIHLGKHSLRFSEDVTTVMSFVEPEADTQAETDDHPGPVAKDTDSFAAVVPQASLQFMNGVNIGRLIPLTRKVTEIKHHDLVPAIIARRASGFYISRLLDDVDISIGGEALSTDGRLNAGDQLQIGTQRFQFFEDND